MHREKQQAEILIAAVKRQFPDVTDDELLTVIEGETDLLEAVEKAIWDALRVEAHADGLKALMDDLKARQERLRDRAQRLRSAVLEVCETAGIRKHEFAGFTVSVGKSPASVVITDPGLIPESLTRVTVAPDKTAIKAAMQDGPVPGAELSNAAPRLIVRTK